MIRINQNHWTNEDFHRNYKIKTSFCQFLIQIPNGETLAMAIATFTDGTDRFCGRIFTSIAMVTAPGTVCSKSTEYKFILFYHS